MSDPPLCLSAVERRAYAEDGFFVREGALGKDEMEDIRDAVETMARRSEGLMRFVRSYRQLTRMPPPQLEKIVVGDFFNRLETLLKTELAQKKIHMSCSSRPTNITLLADKDMLDQAMINVVRNAADAVRDTAAGKIDICAFIDGKQRPIRWVCVAKTRNFVRAQSKSDFCVRIAGDVCDVKCPLYLESFA